MPHWGIGFYSKIKKVSQKQGAFLRALVPHALVWVTWEECNNRCFKENSKNLDQLINRVKEYAWGWISDKPVMKNLRVKKMIFLLAWSVKLFATDSGVFSLFSSFCSDVSVGYFFIFFLEPR